MPDVRDLITDDNVLRTYTENKYVCFLLKNGFTVKLNPNQVNKGSGAVTKGG